jgi:hypothetical protein
MKTTQAKGGAPRVKGKVWTRAKAEKALARGADPEQFLKHQNKHVRVKAERKSRFIAAHNEVLDRHEETFAGLAACRE